MTATDTIDQLLESGQSRIIYEVPLRPTTGTRFQPTGFPDLGAAVYRDPSGGGDRMLVESPQSMANRLEAVCWDEAEDDVIDCLKGMPYVRVQGDATTSSLLEAHRLNSLYILSDSTFREGFEVKAGIGKGAVDRSIYARALLFYDPNSLVHGSYMSRVKSGTARLERLLSAFIEAEDIELAQSSGVMFDRNDTSGRDAGGSQEGFGNVLFHRSEYCARSITASFSLDLATLRGLRLPATGTRLVALLALYKVRALLSHPMRLRTACDLEMTDAPWSIRPDGAELPQLEDLAEALGQTIAQSAKEELFSNPPVTDVTFRAGKSKKKA